MPRNLVEVLYDRRAPESPAILQPDGHQLSTEALRSAIARYAEALMSLGVQQGSRVSFKLEKCVEAICLTHACFLLGAIAHPLNTAYTEAETSFLIADAEPILVVCDPSASSGMSRIARGVGARLETLGPGVGSLSKRAADCPGNLRPVAVEQGQTAALLYTSGTTGRPKGAMITHANLSDSAEALAEVWRMTRSDVLLHALPTYHAHGLLTSINVLLVAGGSVLFLPLFSAGEVIAALSRATVMMGVPTHYKRLLLEPSFPPAIQSSFRLFICGSAPLSAELAAAFREQAGRTLIERYGSTEAAIVTAVPAGTCDRSGWVGWPLPGVEVRVAKKDKEPSQVGEGALETRGHNIFGGYWRRPASDAEAFTADGWFRTGDLAEIDASGCVRLLGRDKDLIITGGLNVYPAEVEAVLDALPEVIESAVFGVPHPDFGEAVVAAVTAGNGFDELATIAAARRSLAGYKAPKRIVVIGEIPRSQMGKVLRTELRVRFDQLFDQTSMGSKGAKEK
jgi:malonyl-CoA/methylmalonyl-CoA synthetase